MDLSIVIPIYNEEENIRDLGSRILQALDGSEYQFEVILVNDGSSDSSERRLNELAASDQRFRVLHFRRNFGQTAAMMAGIDYARGEVIVPMDGDLQNDPADVPKLLAKLAEGYDVCSGWRKDRKDHALKRNFPSRVANWLISRLSGVRLHDYGCSLKAYRRDVIKDVRLYGEMHRFIPIYASMLGARVTEVTVGHSPRTHGRSKYGMERIFKVLLDLLVVKFLHRYMEKPMYFFGKWAMASFAASFLVVVAMLYYKFAGGKSFVETPLPVVFTLTALCGFLCILMGILAEINVRIYYEAQGKKTYLVRYARNVDPPKIARDAETVESHRKAA